jgi:signal transduction histidine kinase
VVTVYRQQIELMRRNGLRLLKLVNTLLDFSRLEAGRVQALCQPIDLAAYTAELASTFQSAMDQAGLRYVIDCQPGTAPTFVDRDMWEKIVLNLISNAFKYTFEGEIAVSLRESAGHGRVELRLQHTGVGIPKEELPRLFERFHRIEGQHGRTHEGTGISLALVQELARLHGGTIEVTSAPGQGSCFTVSIPVGKGSFAGGWNRCGAQVALDGASR